MINKKTFKTFLSIGLLAFTFLVLLPSKVYAGFGVSPATIENETVKKGTTLVQEMVLSRPDTDEEQIAIIEPDLGELNEWVTFNPSPRIVLPKGEQRANFQVLINIPAEAASKDYSGVFRVFAEPTGQVKGLSIVEGVRVDISLTTTEVSVVDLSIRAVKIPDTYEKEDLILEITTDNQGNTPASPSKAEIEVQNLLEESIKTIETSTIEQAVPYQISTIRATFKDHGLKAGEYFGLVSVYEDNDVFYKDRVVFIVKPERIYEEVCTGVPQVISENLNWVFFGLSGLALIVLLIMLRRESNDKEHKDDKRKRMIVALTLFIIFEAIIFPLVYLNITGLLSGSCEMVEVQQDPESTLAQDDREEVNVSVEPTSQIQGITTEKNDETGNLVVSSDTSDGKYKIYREPNLSSAVIYLAEEGEEFNVIEERADWYRVQTNDGTDGWLPKDNVKDSVIEEQ